MLVNLCTIYSAFDIYHLPQILKIRFSKLVLSFIEFN